ncbi:hypothetical protein ACLB9X_02965 [Streptomyces sp. 5K101]|uniref:hypothetical protein n=1 Tax=Streptomyces sp. 5K101 TaxID=3390037 RepID=UPI0039758AEA
MTGNLDGDLPFLRHWLEGVQAHPLRWYFESRRPNLHPSVVFAWWRNPILRAVEETLAILEAAQPDGLGAKRREFRAFRDQSGVGMDQFMTHRAELTVASHLAESGIPFRFNGGEGPDILLGSGEQDFGIEVSSRRPKSLRSLTQELSTGLRARGLPSAVSYSTNPIPPVLIRDKVRKEILEAFLPTDGTPGVTSMRVMASPARPDDGIPASWVTIEVSSRGGYGRMSAPHNSPHMIAMAQEVARNVLREKRKVRQSKLLPSVLIVDLSDTDLPDLRCWPEVFSKMWEETDQFLALAAMTMITRSREPKLSFSLNPFIDRKLVEEFVELVAPCAAFGSLSDRLQGRRLSRWA